MTIDPNNPWHKVSVGERAPEYVTGIIEIPKNTRAKYELDKVAGMLKLDRVLYSSMYYPANYGFIPQTYCDDKDPLPVVSPLHNYLPCARGCVKTSKAKNEQGKLYCAPETFMHDKLNKYGEAK